MNEEELKKGCGKKISYKDYHLYCGDSNSLRQVFCSICKARLEGFQKGKLEAEKEELNFLNGVLIYLLVMKEHIETNNCPLPTLRLNDEIERVKKRIKQLQKEIGEEKQDDAK